MINKILIIAGEASGDLHGGKLVKSLKLKNLNLEIFGIGGERMAAAGMEIIYHIDQLAFLGFGEVIKHLPFVRKVFRHMVRVLKVRQPDVVVLIDYPGFNLRFAKAAKRLGFKVFYYIAPQVWAWGKNRSQKMAHLVDKLAVIFDFEVPLFRDAGVDVEFVGHPLLDTITTKYDRETFYNNHKLNLHDPLLALLPGSRIQEVEKMLPPLLESIKDLHRKHGKVQIVIGGAATVPEEYYYSFLREYPQTQLIQDSTYDVIAHSDAAIVASGTATLETAWFGTPFALVYKVSGLSYLIGKILIKIPYIGLVNVVAGKCIVPEILQNGVNPKILAPIMERLIFDDDYRQSMSTELRKVKNMLGRPGAASSTAELVLSVG